MNSARRTSFAFLSGLLSIGMLFAAQRPIDTANSTITVRVYKAGVFSAFGHDHTITAPIASGAADTEGRTVELKVKSAAMKVVDPNASEKDKAEIQHTMAGPEVLDTAQYPEISFRSRSVTASGGNAWSVHGELSLHGQSRPVDVEVREAEGRYRGTAALRLSDFGIKPVKIAGGAVKVKDEIRIEFDIQLAK